jgi:hypothetical protein
MDRLHLRKSLLRYIPTFGVAFAALATSSMLHWALPLVIPVTILLGLGLMKLSQG